MKTLKYLSLVSILLLNASFVAAAEMQVGLVNIQKVISSVKEGKDVIAKLEKSFKSKQKDLKAQKEKIDEFEKKIRKQSALLSDKAKLEKQREYREKVANFQKKQMGYNNEMQKQEAELKRPILKKLKPIIDTVSEKENVFMTFEVSTSPVVYAKKQIDLTDKVIKAYDKKYK